jgi:hypothetical protein
MISRLKKIFSIISDQMFCWNEARELRRSHPQPDQSSAAQPLHGPSAQKFIIEIITGTTSTSTHQTTKRSPSILRLTYLHHPTNRIHTEAPAKMVKLEEVVDEEFTRAQEGPVVDDDDWDTDSGTHVPYPTAWFLDEQSLVLITSNTLNQALRMTVT